MRNWNIFCSVLLVFFICSSNFSLIEAQDKIEGPWYWLIVDTSKKVVVLQLLKMIGLRK